MGIVSSHVGNQGEYDIADKINIKILENALINRRIGMLHVTLYDILWNKEQRNKKQHPVFMGVDIKQELIKCIHLCEMSGNLRRITFYQKKLENNI